MKLNKIMLAAVMSLSVVSFAQAAGQGGGKVTFTGSIVDAPCSIHPDSLDQTVPMGAISNVALKDGGTSTPRDFSIRLEQCDFGSPATRNKVTTTFTGVSSSVGTDLLAINGTASGAGIAITTYDGAKVKLGVATPEVTLTGATPVLQYQAYLQGASEGAVPPAVDTPIVPGDFTAVANFELAYQ